MALFGFGKALSFGRRPLAGSSNRVTVVRLWMGAAEIDFCDLCRTPLAIHVFREQKSVSFDAWY